MAGALGLLLLGVLLGGGLFLAREDPDEQTLDAALDEFRGDGEQTSTTADDARPAEGVYEAVGEGESSLGLLGLTQEDGPSIPITVVHEGDGCWSLEMALNVAHRQVNHLCRDAGGDLVEARSETEQSWDLGAISQDNRTTFTCDGDAGLVLPADAEPGDSWPQRCTGVNSAVDGSTTSEGTTTFIGEEALVVDGQEVAVLHVRQERTISGTQEGSQTVDHWYAADTGLLVREVRRQQVTSDSPVGAIEYVEDGEWQLTSLEPRT